MRGGIIIFEGPDGVGKTTAIGVLANAFRDAGMHVVFYGNGPPDPLKNARKQYIELAERYINAAVQGTVVMVDRFHLGEFVYGRLLRGGSRISEMDAHVIESLMAEEEGIVSIVVQCVAPLNVIRARLMERDGGAPDSKSGAKLDQVAEIARLFDEVFAKGVSMPVIRVDMSDSPFGIATTIFDQYSLLSIGAGPGRWDIQKTGGSDAPARTLAQGVGSTSSTRDHGWEDRPGEGGEASAQLPSGVEAAEQIRGGGLEVVRGGGERSDSVAGQGGGGSVDGRRGLLHLTAPAAYGSLAEAYVAVMHALMHGDTVECAPRGKLVAEMRTPCVFSISNVHDVLLPFKTRALNHRFAAAEACWIASGSDDLESIAQFNSVMRQFSDDGKTLWGAYGPRIIQQIEHVIRSIQRDPYTRQAVLTTWREHSVMNAPRARENSTPRFIDDSWHSKDIPCTVAWHFQLRDDKLNLTVFMRSNDAWLGLPYDVFSFTTIQRAVASVLGTESGVYTHVASNMHLYETNWDEAEALLAETSALDLPRPKMPAFDLTFRGLRFSTQVRRMFRSILDGNTVDYEALSAFSDLMTANKATPGVLAEFARLVRPSKAR